MAASLPSINEFGTVFVVALLVVTAGCSGLPLGTAANTTSTTANPTTIAPTTQSTTTTSAEQTTTTAAEPRSVAASGEMAVVIDDRRLDPLSLADTNKSSEFWFDEESNSGEWQRTNASVTVAEALATMGIDVSANSISYDGTTYRDSASNTSVAVRVDGESVAPTEYVLKPGDQVWVVVITHPLDQSVPGDHIGSQALHVHGQIDMTINGEAVDFTKDKYQIPGHNAHFHFEGSSAKWHAHSWSVTLSYAMGTLPGISVSEGSVTFNNTTYDRSDPGTTITFEVNGEPVNPSRYVLKDGDKITITVTTEDG